MFTAALFTTAKTRKPPKCPSRDEQIKKMGEVPLWLRSQEPDTVSRTIWVQSLASLSGLRIQCCHKQDLLIGKSHMWYGSQMWRCCGCGVGLNCSSDSTPTWELPHVTGVAIKREKKKKKKKKKRCGTYILLSHKKRNTAICSNKDGPKDYHTKWRQIWYHLYVKSENTNELLYKTETDSDTEDNIMVSEGEGGREEYTRSLGLSDTHHYV